MNASLWRDGGRLVLRFDYDADFITELKAAIPARSRRWDPDDKVWLFDPAQFRRLRTLLDEWFDEVDIDPSLDGLGGDPPPTAKVSPTVLAYAELFGRLPYRVLHKVHRALMLELHPDREGGDLRLAQAANAAWDRLGREQRGGR